MCCGISSQQTQFGLLHPCHVTYKYHVPKVINLPYSLGTTPIRPDPMTWSTQSSILLGERTNLTILFSLKPTTSGTYQAGEFTQLVTQKPFDPVKKWKRKGDDRTAILQVLFCSLYIVTYDPCLFLLKNTYYHMGGILLPETLCK